MRSRKRGDMKALELLLSGKGMPLKQYPASLPVPSAVPHVYPPPPQQEHHPTEECLRQFIELLLFANDIPQL